MAGKKYSLKLVEMRDITHTLWNLFQMVAVKEDLSLASQLRGTTYSQVLCDSPL